MPHRAKITISNRQGAVGVRTAHLRRLVEFVTTAENRSVEDIDVAIVDAGEMESLNSRYLDRSDVTDVLSFDLSRGGSQGISAQIIVCGDVAADEGPRHGLSAQSELMLYVIHGLLHLTDYDDATAAQAERMNARQEELLGQFGKPG